MRRPLLLLLLTAASIAPATARTPDTPDAVLAGRTPGKPESCISQRLIDSSHLYPDGRILYRMRGGPDYLNTAGPGCATTILNPVMITATPTNQLCQGDIMRVADSASRITYGSCGLGEFVPYPRVKKAKP
jgi:hypothetical protein